MGLLLVMEQTVIFKYKEYFTAEGIHSDVSSPRYYMVEDRNMQSGLHYLFLGEARIALDLPHVAFDPDWVR